MQAGQKRLQSQISNFQILGSGFQISASSFQLSIQLWQCSHLRIFDLGCLSHKFQILNHPNQDCQVSPNAPRWSQPEKNPNRSHDSPIEKINFSKEKNIQFEARELGGAFASSARELSALSSEPSALSLQLSIFSSQPSAPSCIKHVPT